MGLTESDRNNDEDDCSSRETKQEKKNSWVLGFGYELKKVLESIIIYKYRDWCEWRIRGDDNGAHTYARNEPNDHIRIRVREHSDVDDGDDDRDGHDDHGDGQLTPLKQLK